MLNTIDYDQIVSDFLNNGWSDNKELARAVIAQFGDEESFVLSAPDVANYGIDGGYGGFIYYADTVPFAIKNKREILSYAKEQAESFGDSGVFAMIASFNCFTDLSESDIAEAFYEEDENGDNHTTLFNGLAWYIGEEVSRSFESWASNNNHIVNEFSFYEDEVEVEDVDTDE